jgi:predicted transcriptional regulator
MSHEIKVLRPRHQEVIRLAFLGRSNVEIASAVGISTAAVSCVLRSPLAQAEIARFTREAEERIVNVPLRARMMSEIEGASVEALRLNRTLMNEQKIDTKLRVGIAKHFMDRGLFEKDGDEQEGSYREILRKLDDVQKQLGGGVYLLTQPEPSTP